MEEWEEPAEFWAGDDAGDDETPGDESLTDEGDAWPDDPAGEGHRAA